MTLVKTDHNLFHLLGHISTVIIIIVNISSQHILDICYVPSTALDISFVMAHLYFT